MKPASYDRNDPFFAALAGDADGDASPTRPGPTRTGPTLAGPTLAGPRQAHWGRRLGLIAVGVTGMGLGALLTVLAACHLPQMMAHADGTMSMIMPMPTSDGAAKPPFQVQMDRAMMTMDSGMALPYSGNADRDFARMMIPHHQGAVDMAQLEMHYGNDARLRRLAQEIIVTQRQEIAVMQLALQQMPASPTKTGSTP
jgi:hypothetical protein